ncbi:MAG TPA: hypothetical protein PKC30_13180 [Saprospiraceae bacterium]|nr:hypothetical protein [Saprospiraceae bacterium]
MPFKQPGGFYLGGRWEEVPSSDLVGGSGCYRRPGYVFSIEPGLTYSLSHTTFVFNVPVAIGGNRTQSYLDKQRTIDSGIYTHGDTAFAEYLINFNVTHRFSTSINPNKTTPINPIHL